MPRSSASLAAQLPTPQPAVAAAGEELAGNLRESKVEMVRSNSYHVLSIFLIDMFDIYVTCL